MTKHVLIVDDDEDDCDLFCDAVKIVDADADCEKIHNAKKALALLSTDYKPDYIFLDLNMPLFDGKSCLIEIRKMRSLIDVPVIIYTTSKREADKERTAELGANYFMTKPISLKELCGEISFVFLNRWELGTTRSIL